MPAQQDLQSEGGERDTQLILTPIKLPEGSGSTSIKTKFHLCPGIMCLGSADTINTLTCRAALKVQN